MSETRPGEWTDLGYEALARSTKATIDLIDALCDSTRACQQPRKQQRLPLAFTAPAVALDEQFRPVGDQFTLTLRDVGPRGLAMLDTQPIDSKYVAVELALGTARKRAVVHVRHCDRIGPYYQMAGTWMKTLTGPGEGHRGRVGE